MPQFVLSPVYSYSFLNELTKSDRGASGLAIKPVPMPWQQRDFTGHNTEFGKKMSKTVKLVVVFMNVREVVQTNCKGEYSMPAYEGI
jgi:hypothetical protein